MRGAQAKLSHSPHFIELELVGWVGRFPPMVSWIEAVEDGVWGEQVAGRRMGETNQHQPGLRVSLGQPLTGSEPREGDYKLGFKSGMAFPLIPPPKGDLSPSWL